MDGVYLLVLSPAPRVGNERSGAVDGDRQRKGALTQNSAYRVSSMSGHHPST
jgi:hypothetical protein